MNDLPKSETIREENDSAQEVQAQTLGVIEALLFISEKPLTVDELKKVLRAATAAEIKKAVQSLNQEYTGRLSGMTILEIAGGYQMLTNPRYAPHVREFFKTKHKEKLSKPALETLAIVAYKQPVTRMDIELIRGVNSDGVVAHLVDKELVKIAGRKDIPGRPFLYGTTKQFLEYFGLKSLESLPKLEEFPDLKPVVQQDSSDPASPSGPAEQETGQEPQESQASLSVEESSENSGVAEPSGAAQGE